MKFTTKKIAISGMVMALYVVVMYFTQTFAFEAIQVRLATSIYSLGAMFPFLIIPLGLANALSNLLFGGLGTLDIVGGFIIGIMTAGGCYLVKKLKLNDWLTALPIVLIPGLCAPIWLSYLLSIPYLALAGNLLIGQSICGILGVILYKVLMKYRGQLHV